jgi:hypothetical protein
MNIAERFHSVDSATTGRRKIGINPISRFHFFPRHPFNRGIPGFWDQFFQKLESMVVSANRQLTF